MNFPEFLGEEFTSYRKFRDEDLFFQELIQTPSHALRFFLLAAEDHSYRSSHVRLMKKFLKWMTESFFVKELTKKQIQPIIHTLHNHFSFFSALLFEENLSYPNKILFHFGKIRREIPSFFAGFYSEFFFDRILTECWLKNAKELNFPEIPEEVIFNINEFIEKGGIDSLWKQGPEILLKTLEKANEWIIPSLMQEISHALKKYLSLENIVSFLLKAHKQNLYSLKKECYRFLNEASIGITCKEKGDEHLYFGFLFFHEEGKKIFSSLASKITYLSFVGNSLDDSQSFDILEKTPSLKGLEIGRTIRNDRIIQYFLPLKEIDLSEAVWLNDDCFIKYAKDLTHTQKIELKSIAKLSYLGLKELRNFPSLYEISFSSCSWMTDEEAILIIRSLLVVKSLSFSYCQNLSDDSTKELVNLRSLEYLDLSGCSHITDEVMIAIGSSNEKLRFLSLNHCHKITLKSIKSLLFSLPELQKIDLRNCFLEKKEIEALQDKYPYVTIIF